MKVLHIYEGQSTALTKDKDQSTADGSSVARMLKKILEDKL